MIKLLAWRVAQFPLILAVIYLITFFFVWIAPGSPFGRDERKLNPIVEQARSLCESEMALRKIQIRWEANPRLPKVWASENHIEQVFVNILMNALHAMPDGGILSIKASLIRPKAYMSGQPWKESIAYDRDHVAVEIGPRGFTVEHEHRRRIWRSLVDVVHSQGAVDVHVVGGEGITGQGVEAFVGGTQGLHLVSVAQA